MSKKWNALLLATLAGCGGGSSGPTPPVGPVTTVTFVYLAPTSPTLPATTAFCVAMVGPTHIHPSWRSFDLVPMTVTPPDRFELTLTDVPLDRRLSIRVSDANACLENPTGAATRNVRANAVLLTEIVSTPGSGPEPGLAFTVDATGRVTP